MTIMAQQIEFKNWTNTNKHTTIKEAIHSGHFMVSEFEAEEQDEDELAVPVPEEVELKTNMLLNDQNLQRMIRTNEIHREKSGHQLSIETSLSKLFQCMSLAYRQKLTSPKWNRFKGIRLRWKDKIRLNNVIWRCWHIQFINKKKTLVCQFASPLDVDTHNKPEAVVLEGKYWKRKLNAVTAEYKKWRMYSHNQILGKPLKNHDIFAELDSQEYWPLNCADNMMVDEDYMGLMTDTLFSTISAQPFPFPDPREIARNTNLADFIQPSLVQLQPNLDEIMDIEPLHDLLQSSKLSTVPENTDSGGVLQSITGGYPTDGKLTTMNTSNVLSTTAGVVVVGGPTTTNYQTNPAATTTMFGPTSQQQPAPSSQQQQQQQDQTLWYLPPDFVDITSGGGGGVTASGSTAQYQSTTSSSITRPPNIMGTAGVVPTPIPPQPPPMPILPSKNDSFTSPKNKSKLRTRNSSKKLHSYTTNQQHNIISPMLTTSPQQQQQQPSSSTLQNSNLLAQILTNNTHASYGFLPKDQTTNTPCDDVTFIQQTFAPLNNQIIYKPDSTSNIHKSANTTAYLINNETTNTNSVQQQTQRTTSPVITTTMLNKSVLAQQQQQKQQQPLNNMVNVCGESLAITEPLSLSPLNVGSPTSPPCTKEAAPVKEQRRVCHINAEQKRRCNIKNGFDTLHSLIPQLNQNPNAKMSKASMLQKGADYIRQLRIDRSNLKQEIDSLRKEIDSLNTAICNCQALLPATGAPISRQRSNKLRDMFRQYVKTRTHENWKFWLLSLICEPLLESFNNCVSTNSLDELYHTTLQWVDQNCTLVILRQVVLNSLRQLCTTTDVLTDPTKLPNEAKIYVDKLNKKQS